MTPPRIDRLSLMAGSFFIVAGALLLLDRLGAVEISASWLWPALLIAVGAGIVVSAVSR